MADSLLTSAGAPPLTWRGGSCSEGAAQRRPAAGPLIGWLCTTEFAQVTRARSLVGHICSAAAALFLTCSQIQSDGMAVMAISCRVWLRAEQQNIIDALPADQELRGTWLINCKRTVVNTCSGKVFRTRKSAVQTVCNVSVCKQPGNTALLLLIPMSCTIPKP